MNGYMITTTITSLDSAKIGLVGIRMYKALSLTGRDGIPREPLAVFAA